MGSNGDIPLRFIIAESTEFALRCANPTNDNAIVIVCSALEFYFISNSNI